MVKKLILPFLFMFSFCLLSFMNAYKIQVTTPKEFCGTEIDISDDMTFAQLRTWLPRYLREFSQVDPRYIYFFFGGKMMSNDDLVVINEIGCNRLYIGFKEKHIMKWDIIQRVDAIEKQLAELKSLVMEMNIR